MSIELKYFKSTFNQFQLTLKSLDNFKKWNEGIHHGVPLLTMDGRKIWLEHFSLSDKSLFNYEKAKQADIVICCYPYYSKKQHNLNNVLFSDHRLRCGVKVENDTLICQTLATGNTKHLSEHERDDLFIWMNNIRLSLIN